MGSKPKIRIWSSIFSTEALSIVLMNKFKSARLFVFYFLLLPCMKPLLCGLPSLFVWLRLLYLWLWGTPFFGLLP